MNRRILPIEAALRVYCDGRHGARKVRSLLPDKAGRALSGQARKLGCKFGRATSKDAGKQCVPSSTGLVGDDAKKDVKMSGQKRMQEVAKDRELVTPPRQKVREEEEEMPTEIWKTPPTKVPPTVRVEQGQVPV